MCALLVMQEDPVCDTVQVICGTCHYSDSCDYLSSGQIELCATVMLELEDEYPTETNLNTRLERCFEDMLKKSRSKLRKNR